MVAYSRQMRADEAGTLAALKAARRQSIDPVIDGAGGRIFKTMGDGVLCEFSSVVSAVSCALEMQRALGQCARGGAGVAVDADQHDAVGDAVERQGEAVVSAFGLRPHLTLGLGARGRG